MKVYLHPARGEDMKDVLALRNSAEIVRLGQGRRSGIRWWGEVSPDLWVIEIDDDFAGYIIAKPTPLVSIALVKAHRRRGIGAKALRKFNGLALIDPKNVASVKAFKKAGFHEQRRHRRPLRAFTR